jgi:hypothetical protein
VESFLLHAPSTTASAANAATLAILDGENILFIVVLLVEIFGFGCFACMSRITRDARASSREKVNF